MPFCNLFIERPSYLITDTQSAREQNVFRTVLTVV